MSIAEVVRTTQSFPRYLGEEANEALVGEVIRGEVEGILNSMQKDKSPHPDGWTVELFRQFYETIGNELTEVV